MTWLIPSALAIAGAAALATVALHFIARSRPVAEPFPTARFIPERSIHARTRSLALTDVLLLVLRGTAIMLLGVAVAAPIFAGGRRVTRIVIADRSRTVAAAAGVRDSARAYLRRDDQLIVFDSSAARPGGASALDSLVTSDARGSLSAALAAAIRAASRVASQTDSIEVVLVSPLAEEEADDATPRIRATWPGRIRVVPVRSALALDTLRDVDVRAPANDAVAAGLSLIATSASSSSVRVIRERMTAADSAWARGRGHVLVHWPATDDGAEWLPRQPIDAIGGVTANGATVVARFPRLWSLQGFAIARWADGEPAAVERAVGEGCIRDVAVLIDEASDVTLRAPFRRFVTELLAPCGGVRATRPLSAEYVASLAGSGGLASARALGDGTTGSSRWTPWLLAVAALLLIAELAIRRTVRSAS
jgi:hypothetical protein